MINIDKLETELNQTWALHWLGVYENELTGITEENELLINLQKICQIWRGNGAALENAYTWQQQLEQIFEATKENFDKQIVTDALGQAAQLPGILTYGCFMW